MYFYLFGLFSTYLYDGLSLSILNCHLFRSYGSFFPVQLIAFIILFAESTRAAGGQAEPRQLWAEQRVQHQQQ